MEGNVCDSNHVDDDDDVRPPPRKRLLAGFKKQNNNEQSVSPPTPTTCTEVDARVKNLLTACDGSGSSSLEEIAESSMKTALAAAEVAEAARAAAEEKAAVSAKAIAAAKNALDLVASFYEETSHSDRHSRRNKSKKQVTVMHDEVENGITDETEHKLHRVIHTSSTNSPTSSYSKSHNHKKHKVSPVIGKPEFPNGKGYI